MVLFVERHVTCSRVFPWYKWSSQWAKYFDDAQFSSGYKHLICLYSPGALETLRLIYTWPLTHWGRVTHICVGKLTSIASDKGLSHGRRQAIIWNIAGIMLIGTLGTFNRNSNIFIEENTFENVVGEISAILSQPQCANYMKWWESSLWGIFLTKAVEHKVELPAIWHAMTLVFCHCHISRNVSYWRFVGSGSFQVRLPHHRNQEKILQTTF